MVDTQAFKISSATLMGLYQHDLEQFTLLQMNMGREVSRRLRDATEQIFRLQIHSSLDSPHVPRRYDPDSGHG